MSLEADGNNIDKNIYVIRPIQYLALYLVDMKIVILSRNAALYSTQSIVRAARRRGHDVKVVDHMYADIHVERNNLVVEYFGQRLDDVDAVIPRIGASATEYGAAVIRQFEGSGVFTTLKSSSLLNSRDKMRCLQILASNGIHIPRSAMTNNLSSVDRLLDIIGSVPWVIKLLVSTQGLGVVKAETRPTAKSIFESFYRLKQKALLQEYIGEAGGEDIRVLVIGGQIAASMSRKSAGGDFRSNLHRGGRSTPVRLTSKEEAIARRVTRVLDLDVAGVDILRSKRGPLVLEANASPGLEGIETTTGIDISNKILQLVERKVRQRK
ncbi:MAG: RimK family alpha-L-glutamate ligase [Saprospiraceae bacterium]|nr:RimK family alpha-L-glutamate ligase [Saprospiraceae bacterium]